MSRRSNLDFVEGIIIGIYGNWLISLIDRIDFESIQPLYFAILLVSFVAFVIYFIYLLSEKAEITSLRKNLLLTGFHYCGWLLVYYEYGIGTFAEKVFFSLLGMFLLSILLLAENRRIGLLV